MGAVEERGGTKLRVSWPGSEVDSGHFDMDFLVEFNKTLAKIKS